MHCWWQYNKVSEGNSELPSKVEDARTLCPVNCLPRLYTLGKHLHAGTGQPT